MDRPESILREILGFMSKLARLRKEKVNVGELVDDMVLLMKIENRERILKFSRKRDPGIYVDANRIREAFRFNIFINAV